jgi:uncharacterized protein
MSFLIWLALAVITFFAIRSKIQNMRAHLQNVVKAELEAQAVMQKKAAVPAETMVACAHCHVYLPASEAIHPIIPSTNHYFCSEDHRRLHSISTVTPGHSPSE